MMFIFDGDEEIKIKKKEKFDLASITRTLFELEL